MTPYWVAPSCSSSFTAVDSISSLRLRGGYCGWMVERKVFIGIFGYDEVLFGASMIDKFLVL
jgi:hypothetical protein